MKELGADMEYMVGAILEGTVKSITKFGAFIALPEGKSGLVHISEIAHTYVSEVREFLTEGQTVKVQIIAIDPAGKIGLSIKRTQPRPSSAPKQAESNPPRSTQVRNIGAFGEIPLRTSNDRIFEDKLKAFMSESDSKIAGSHQYERKTRSRKR